MNDKPDIPHIPRNGNFIIVVHPGDTSLKWEELVAQPTLEQLQSGVGGSIELVPHFTKLGPRQCVAFCNEEGKIHGLKPNQLAHILWESSYGSAITTDYLVGPIVIIVGTPSFLSQL
jgi:hypothetical protein